MPSIHIPEDTWAQLLVLCDGDREQAREIVKESVADAVDRVGDDE